MKTCSKCGGERKPNHPWCQPCRTQRERELRSGPSRRKQKKIAALRPIPTELRQTLAAFARDQGLID